MIGAMIDAVTRFVTLHLCSPVSDWIVAPLPRAVL